MIDVVSTNIISPLGSDTELNYRAVREGRSALVRYSSWKGIPEPFTASLFSDEQNAGLSVEGYTRFESLCIRSISDALSRTASKPDCGSTVLILCTTKADIEELGPSSSRDGNYHSPGVSARRISAYFGFQTDPITVCNACISGVTGQTLALRLIDTGRCSCALVCGADLLTPFTVAGFQSFKALSPDGCRPFDIERIGLNIGEAAATIIFKKHDADADEGVWCLCAGELNNDGYHVSAPSPDGDGTYRAIQGVLKWSDKDDLAEICAHGTATMFNDQMESRAIERAGLSSIPVTALKGYFGHTMGAAGVLETILTMRSLEDGIVLGTRGFKEIGVSGKISISQSERTSDKSSFLKIISGFGGCNGAVLYGKNIDGCPVGRESKSISVRRTVSVTPSSVMVDGKVLPIRKKGKDLLTEIMKTYLGDCPKFYKMDTFSRLSTVAASLLEKDDADVPETGKRGVILFNRSSSIVADRNHIATICEPGNFYPSPSVFLYTLPNIATGEIAIQHHYYAETTLYILDSKNEEQMESILNSTVALSDLDSVITGWVDCESDDVFEADLKLVTVK